MRKTAKPVTTAKPATRLTSWPAAIDAYELHLRAKRAGARTVDDYLREVRLLREHLCRRDPDRAPSQVTLQDLRDYQVGLLTGAAARRGRPLGAGTVARVHTVLAGFFEFLANEGLVADDPARRLERVRVPDGPPKDVLTVDEVERILALADASDPVGLRDRAAVELLYGTGVRRKELIDLALGDVDHHERVLVVRAGKGGKGRTIPIVRSTYLALQEYLARARPELARAPGENDEATLALLLTRRGQPLTPGVVKGIVDRLAKAAGIEKRLTPHTFRRTYATHLLKHGVNLRVIQALLGHRSLNTTAVYLRLDASEVRREVLLHHPRERIEA